jgi:hypothetical protein
MRKYQVIIPNDLDYTPEKHEISAAKILAGYFKSDVKFVKRTNLRTPDLQIGNQYWEMKSPTGVGKRNIQNNLQTAVGQSPNVVLDARRSKMRIEKFVAEAKRQYKIIVRMKSLIIITKAGKVLDIEK